MVQCAQGTVTQLEVLETASCEAVPIASSGLVDAYVAITLAEHEGAASAQPWDVRTEKFEIQMQQSPRGCVSALRNSPPLQPATPSRS
jgi:hypothetical protein